MTPKFVFNVLSAAVCLIAAGLYADEALKSYRQDDEWDKVITDNGVQESTDVLKTE
jgi:hypothetical protein